MGFCFSHDPSKVSYTLFLFDFDLLSLSLLLFDFRSYPVMPKTYTWLYTQDHTEGAQGIVCDAGNQPGVSSMQDKHLPYHLSGNTQILLYKPSRISAHSWSCNSVSMTLWVKSLRLHMLYEKNAHSPYENDQFTKVYRLTRLFASPVISWSLPVWGCMFSELCGQSTATRAN